MKNNPNKELAIHFITYILNHDEIKMKVCEKLLINCRFNSELSNDTGHEHLFPKFSNPNDNNKMVFNNFKTLLVNNNQSNKKFLFTKLKNNLIFKKSEKANSRTIEFTKILNAYINCFFNLNTSGEFNSLICLNSILN